MTSYGEAAKELESILSDLESDRLDVDEVVLKVKRAGELIEVCRQKVQDAKMQVETVVSKLD